jgi:hypothetical protein
MKMRNSNNLIYFPGDELMEDGPEVDRRAIDSLFEEVVFDLDRLVDALQAEIAFQRSCGPT